MGIDGEEAGRRRAARWAAAMPCLALVLPFAAACVADGEPPPRRRITAVRDVTEGDAPLPPAAPPSVAASGSDDPASSHPYCTQPHPDGASRPASRQAETASRPAGPDPLTSRFGPGSVTLPDGRLTRFFPVQAERGKVMAELLARYGAIPANQIEIVAGVDTQEMRVQAWDKPAPPTKVQISDWVVVTGTPEEVDRAERFMNLYFAAVPQIEIEARIAEITTSDVTDIGVRSTNAAQPMIQSGSHNFIESINPKFPNSSTASEGLLSLTAVQSPIQFQATLELLASRRDVDIISSPRIAVRNGGRAEIINGNEIPYAEITTIVGGVPTSTVKYKQTGVKLYVTPYLAGADTILLTVEVESSNPTSIIADTLTLPATPIIANRSAKTDLHVRDGNTFVIGGLISTNNLQQVNKIPLLGDIPILGLLFRSTLTQKSYTEVLFFITPRVLRDPGSQGYVVPVAG